jgi:ribonuclease HI
MKKFYKGYFDGSVTYNESNDAYGAYVLVSPNNKVVKQNAFKQTTGSSTKIESIALYKLLEVARTHGITHLIVYGDNKPLIDSIKNNKVTTYNKKLLSLIKKFDEIKFIWNSRKHNKYADKLCKMKKQGLPIKKCGGKFSINELMAK